MAQTIKLNNGVSIPQLGFGTWQLHWPNSYQAVAEAIKIGYRHIDTAHIYLNEKSVGKAIASSGIPRKDIFVVTKLWNGDQDHVVKAFDESLNKLGLDYIDLYLIHYPVTATRLAAWHDMEKLLESGRVKAIGVSNFTIKHLEELISNSHVVPAVNQVEFHPYLYQKDLLEFCNDKGIALEAYSPLAHGERIENSVIEDIAKNHNKSNAQVLIRWSLQHGNIVIPKSKNKDRIKENFDVFDFKLNPKEMSAINALNENLRTCWDPTNTP